MIKITDKLEQKQYIKQNWESLAERGKLSEAIKRYFNIKEQLKIDPTQAAFWTNER